MKTIDPKIKENLWGIVAEQFRILTARLHLTNRNDAAVTEALAIAYKAGLDRGYDMGYTIALGTAGDEDE